MTFGTQHDNNNAILTPKKGVSRLSLDHTVHLDYYDSREGTGTELSVTLERERESLLQLWLGVFTSERGERNVNQMAGRMLHFGYKTQMIVGCGYIK